MRASGPMLPSILGGLLLMSSGCGRAPETTPADATPAAPAAAATAAPAASRQGGETAIVDAQGFGAPMVAVLVSNATC